MENLENLDNKTLRAKCLEYGLPDVPITDTSKKLLIKRLRAAIENSSGGSQKPDKKKNRRETTHGIKPRTPTPSERSKEKSKSPSRRTIDPVVRAPPVAALSEKLSLAPAPISQRRRSGRITPITQSEPILTEPVKAKIKSTATIQEESNDDIVWIEDDKTNSRPASRQSRASSLSTSPTVTTTYTHVLAEPIQEINEPVEEEEEEWVDNTKSKFEVFEPRYIQKSAYICGPRGEPYVGSNAGIIPEREQQYYTSSRVSQFGSSRPSLIATAPRITSYDSTKKITTTSSSSNRRHTNIGGSYDVTSPLTYGSSRTSSAFQNLIREDSGDEPEPEPESPFLSDFARKLSRLKAEPVDGGVSRLRTELSQQRELPLRRSGIKNMMGGRKQQESIGESLRQFCMALDQNYGIKRKFYVLSGIAMLIFIYVFFFN